jgi:membrane-associated protein
MPADRFSAAVHRDHPAEGKAMNPLSATSWLSSLGALGVFIVVFAETGLLIGFLLPGDSLLFTAGLFCTTRATAAVHLSLPTVLVAAVAGALLGAQAGFVLGRRGGRPLLAKVRNKHLRSGLARADELFARYGHPKAIMLARFIPVVRTVLNPMAGILAVPTRTFTIWQVAGGTVWSLGVTLAGYGLGAVIPGVDKYLLPAVAVIVLISLTPLALEFLRARRAGHRPAAEPAAPPPVAPAEQPAEQTMYLPLRNHL